MRFKAGEEFAGYRIEAKLGRGGMATVYLARELPLDRQVALKVLPETLVDDADFQARFEQEARVIARLDHPHIVPLYRYGISEDVPWMALRYVDGGDLGARLRAGPLALADGLAIFRGIAAALDYAHQHGVVHRDFKPQNVLLSASGAPYLADFGVAKLLEGSSRLRTQSGSLFGSPAYIAPEQATSGIVSPATDVYALAVTAFQWLTGVLPFDADTPHAVLLKHIHEPLPASALAELPEPVGEVLERALEKAPSARYGSATAFTTALERSVQRAASTHGAVRPGGAGCGWRRRWRRVWRSLRSRSLSRIPPPGGAHRTSAWARGLGISLVVLVIAAGSLAAYASR
jgi:serine/threonine-protein kinase